MKRQYLQYSAIKITGKLIQLLSKLNNNLLISRWEVHFKLSSCLVGLFSSLDIAQEELVFIYLSYPPYSAGMWFYLEPGRFSMKDKVSLKKGSLQLLNLYRKQKSKLLNSHFSIYSKLKNWSYFSFLCNKVHFVIYSC